MLNMADPLTHRGRSILRAVAAGRAETTISSEPDLRIDGLSCCDQTTAHQLAHAGLLRPAHPAKPGSWVRAVFTATGSAALSGDVAAAS